MNRTRPILNIIAPVLLAASLSVVYLATLAPGLTWANDGADGGDLITAAATGGVPHPSGYPLYLLLARLFQYLPVGPLAFRTNLLSAVAAVLAALVVYRLVSRLSGAGEAWQAALAGLVAACAVGLAPLVWSQAVITEVYALQALLVALILYVSTGVFPTMRRERLDALRGGLLGLAMGNHVTSILLAPLMLVTSIKEEAAEPSTGYPLLNPPWHWDWASLRRQVACFFAGLLIYLVLPLRALSDSPVNWGRAVTPLRFFWLVSGSLYQEELFGTSVAGAWGRVQAWSQLLFSQFGALGVILGVAGLVFLFKPSRLYLVTVWTVVAFSIFAITFGSFDSYVYLIPAFMCFAIWIGLAVAGLMRRAQAIRPWLGLGLGVAGLVYFFALVPSHWRQVDASHDLRAEQFGTHVLAAAPQDALLFARGDRAVFALWYFRFALHKRPDVAVVASDLLHFDWYQETLHEVYPSLSIPGPFPWPETIVEANPALPVCYVEYYDTENLDCQPAPSDD